MELTHFLSHRGYQLTLNDRTEDLRSPAKCKACKEVCVGPTYSSNECSDFFLHKSCAELPIEFQSPYHHHPLTLHAVHPGYDSYIACHDFLEDLGLLAYRCEECHLSLDLRCALLKPTKDEGQDHLHCSHFHPLAVKENHAANCSVCLEFSHGALYSCETCKFHLHQSCSHLLQEKLQYFRHQHSLTFRLKQGTIYENECRACGDKITSNYYYNCTSWENCRFKTDINCALYYPPRWNLKVYSCFNISAMTIP